MTKTRRDEETLLNAALLRWMNDLAGQGILVTDAALNIRAWNRWLEEHSELSAGDVLGRNLLEVYTELEKRRLDVGALPSVSRSVRWTAPSWLSSSSASPATGPPKT